MRNLFIKDVATNFVEYHKHYAPIKSHSKAPHPISVSNKARKSLDFQIKPKFVDLNNFDQIGFYNKLAQE